MRNKKLFAVPVLALGVFVLCATAYAQESDQGNGESDKLGPYRLLTTIDIPGGLAGFDISWVDSDHARYYLAARGDPPFNIPVIDTEKDVLLYQIKLDNRANGVVAIHRTGNGEGEPGAGTLVVATTPNKGESSHVFFIDLDHPSAPPLKVDTGGHTVCVRPCRADELAYDPADHLILVANDRDEDLFVTLISTETHEVVGKIFYDGSTKGNPTSTGGIEQPVWDKKTKRFYLAIPSTAANMNGEVDEIDPNATAASGGSDFGHGKITRTFASSAACTAGPAGLALIPGQRLMTSCGDVIDIEKGKVVATVPGVAADEIWFNPGDERVYFGHNPAYVVDAETYKQITGTGPNGPPIPAGSTHSIAADSENNHIFIPVTGVGVKVYTDDGDHENEH